MTTFKKLAIASVAAATLAVSFASSAEAQYRHRHHHRGGGWGAGAGIAAGLLGGAILGSALSRPAYGYGYGGGGYYAAPAYGGGYYAAPAYAQPAVQCQREFSGYYTRSGRPIYNRVCYQY